MFSEISDSHFFISRGLYLRPELKLSKKTRNAAKSLDVQQSVFLFYIQISVACACQTELRCLRASVELVNYLFDRFPLMQRSSVGLRIGVIAYQYTQCSTGR